MLYDIIISQGHNPETFLVEVNKRLKEGWDVVGGISVINCGNAIFKYHQAMIKESPPPQPSTPVLKDNKK